MVAHTYEKRSATSIPDCARRTSKKAAATAKPPIHVHIGGGAAVTAAAAAGAASRARPGVALNFRRPRAIDATSTQARSRITSLDDFVGQRCESFPNGQPGRIVETFQFTREGAIYVTTGTFSGRNTYTWHGNKLQHRQAHHITATLQPNGELAWSHGYGSRICGRGMTVPAVVGEVMGTVVGESAREPPPLHDIVDALKRNLALDGTWPEVVDAACLQLGVAPTGSLQEKADACWRAMEE